MTPDPMRATAERLARDIAAAINKHSAELDSDTPDYILADALTTMLDAMQRAIVARDDWYGGKPGLTHRDRTAGREAASKAWDAAIEAARQWDVPRSFGVSMERERDKFLAAEFDAGERVTPTCERCAGELDGHAPSGPWALHDHDDCIKSLGKRLAEQRGAERGEDDAIRAEFGWKRDPRPLIECIRERVNMGDDALDAHRDRTAEREAARKWWTKGVVWARSQSPVSLETVAEGFAAEFDAGERVTPEESAVWEAIGRYGAEIATSGRMAPPAYLTDAVKRLAEQRGAER